MATETNFGDDMNALYAKNFFLTVNPAKEQPYETTPRSFIDK